MTYTNSLLTKDKHDHLDEMLNKNKDIFAWSHSNMIKIDPTVTSYKLNILSTTQPIRQSPMLSPESSENYLNKSLENAKSRFYKKR